MLIDESKITFGEYVTEDGSEIPYAAIPFEVYKPDPVRVYNFVGRRLDTKGLVLKTIKGNTNVFAVSEEHKEHLDVIMEEHDDIILEA